MKKKQERRGTYLWSPHVESMSDGNNGWGEEKTYKCSSCGAVSPYAQDYRSIVDLMPICYSCHREEHKKEK